MRPDGSGLRRVFDSLGRLANHPDFSPESTPEAARIVFTSDFAGYSAEEISVPHQFQPYGDLFSINIDGTNLQRLTHGELPLLRMTADNPTAHLQGYSHALHLQVQMVPHSCFEALCAWRASWEVCMSSL